MTQPAAKRRFSIQGAVSSRRVHSFSASMEPKFGLLWSSHRRSVRWLWLQRVFFFQPFDGSFDHNPGVTSEHRAAYVLLHRTAPQHAWPKVHTLTVSGASSFWNNIVAKKYDQTAGLNDIKLNLFKSRAGNKINFKCASFYRRPPHCWLQAAYHVPLLLYIHGLVCQSGGLFFFTVNVSYVFVIYFAFFLQPGEPRKQPFNRQDELRHNNMRGNA